MNIDVSVIQSLLWQYKENCNVYTLMICWTYFLTFFIKNICLSCLSNGFQNMKFMSGLPWY